jgi:hypothetical protein
MVTLSALRRTHERMAQMFDEMTNHILKLKEEKIDREWFKSEEFQTLFFEAIDQLHITSDKQKISMLGRALANSGAIEFKAENRKQLFVRLVRDLTPQHIEVLRRIVPEKRNGIPEDVMWQHRQSVSARGDDLLTFQMLAASGLVLENLFNPPINEPSISRYSSKSDLDRVVKDYLKELRKPPIRLFSLSQLGMDFLNFVGGAAETDGKKVATSEK